MSIIINSLLILIALEHVWFLILEMFLWTKPKGLKTFNMTLEVANASAVLAANQGLYNGFLAAGIIMAMLTSSVPFLLFFLSCVVIAGIYGGATVNKKIFFIQSLPALMTLGLLTI